MDEATGGVVLAAATQLYYFDVNGNLLASADTAAVAAAAAVDLPPGQITACCLSQGPEWEDVNVIFTGHTDGNVYVWAMTPPGDAGGDGSADIDGGNGNGGEGNGTSGGASGGRAPRGLRLYAALNREHQHAVTALHLSADQRRLYSGGMGPAAGSARLREEAAKTGSSLEFLSVEPDLTGNRFSLCLALCQVTKGWVGEPAMSGKEYGTCPLLSRVAKGTGMDCFGVRCIGGAGNTWQPSRACWAAIQVPTLAAFGSLPGKNGLDSVAS
ncbi:unnamed protein product [Phaeothamnion confervicola]